MAENAKESMIRDIAPANQHGWIIIVKCQVTIEKRNHEQYERSQAASDEPIQGIFRWTDRCRCNFTRREDVSQTNRRQPIQKSL